MIAVDTNVLARFLLEDDAEGHAQATAVITHAMEEQGLFVPSSVFIELIWLLRKRNWDKTLICTKLELLAHTPNVHIGMRDIVLEALRLYRRGKADFADYLIVVESKHSGAKRLTSFDKVLCREQRFIQQPHEII